MKRIIKHNLVWVALLVGGAAVAAKVIGAKKNEWTGLDESEVRHKVETGLPDRVPAEKRTAVADKVVGTMKTRGLLADEADEVGADMPEELESEIAEAENADDEPSH